MTGLGRHRARAILLGGLLLAAPPPHAHAGEWSELRGRVVAGVQAARAAAGASPLERRPVLDAAAEQRAAAMAARPEADRLSLPITIEETLWGIGVRRFHRARAHVDLQRRALVGGPDRFEPVTGQDGATGAADGLLRRWREYRTGWADAVDPGMDAVGVGAAEAADGWLVTVVILLADQHVPETVPEIERQVFDAVNREREAAGLPALLWDEGAAEIARAHSRDRLARGYLEHVSPEGRDAAARARAAGIRYRQIGENISFNRGARSPVATAVAGWMESPGHRANILDGRYVQAGLGVAMGGDGSLFFTQIFLRPW